MPERLAPDPARFRRVTLEQRPGLQLLHLSLAPGQGVPAHSHPGFEVVFQVLTGAITVMLDGQATTLTAGELLVFAGERTVAPHNESEVAAAALITLAKRAHAP